MTTTKPTADLIGKTVETHVNGRLVRATVLNVFKNGKVQVRPKFARNGDQMTPLTGQPLANVDFGRCEVIGWTNF